MDVVMRMLPAGRNDWMAQCAAGGQAALDMTGSFIFRSLFFVLLTIGTEHYWNAPSTPNQPFK
jgi:hypothetical protein